MLPNLLGYALSLAIPIVVLLILRTLLLLSVVIPAIWSRHSVRRRAALAVLKILTKNYDGCALQPPSTQAAISRGSTDETLR
jgi:hypothetical protein